MYSPFFDSEHPLGRRRWLIVALISFFFFWGMAVRSHKWAVVTKLEWIMFSRRNCRRISAVSCPGWVGVLATLVDTHTCCHLRVERWTSEGMTKLSPVWPGVGGWREGVPTAVLAGPSLHPQPSYTPNELQTEDLLAELFCWSRELSVWRPREGKHRTASWSSWMGLAALSADTMTRNEASAKWVYPVRRCSPPFTVCAQFVCVTHLGKRLETCMMFSPADPMCVPMCASCVINRVKREAIRLFQAELRERERESPGSEVSLPVL